MSRVLLIFNPAAARADPAVVRAVCGVFAGEGWEVDVAGTTRPGDAGELARVGLRDGVDVIAVYGGDGTTMQAVSGIVGHDVPVGLIPGGTGNLLAGNLRLPRDPRAAARVVVHGVPRRIDLGRVERSDGLRYFAVACGAGLDAELMARTTGAAKRRWGVAAYVARTWEVLREVRPARYRVTVDGDVIETEALTALVANCRELIPPFVALRRDIAVDDGVFDVVIISAGAVLEGLDVAWRLVTGRTEGTQRIRYASGRRITVECDAPRPVELDGEPGGTTPFSVEMVPAAISVMVEGTP